MRLLVFFILLSCSLAAQDTLTLKKNVDLKYREDQFYVGITYNTFLNKPSDMAQKTFSPGINLGFLRDMPINQARTFAVATGLGISGRNYFNFRRFKEKAFFKRNSFGNCFNEKHQW